jgi:hypothetical protein
VSWRPHGHVRVNARNPRAAAICDRCGRPWNHERLSFQFDWRGEQLQNLRILVCPTCYDVPQEQLRARILPPDPVPIFNARPEPFAPDGVNYDETNFITTEDLIFQLVDEVTGAYIVAEGWFG